MNQDKVIDTVQKRFELMVNLYSLMKNQKERDGLSYPAVHNTFEIIKGLKEDETAIILRAGEELNTLEREYFRAD